MKTSLKPFNTFGIDVEAQNFWEIKNTTELQQTLDSIQQKPFILGGGSNILLLSDIEIPTLKILLQGTEVVDENDEAVFVKVMAGENWHKFVLYCINNQWGGVENLSLIPGSVGAAPMQNIGAYGAEIKDVFHCLEAMEISTGKVKDFSAEECRFGYRQSVFKEELKNQYCILSMTLRLSKKPELNLEYGAIKDTLEKMHIQKPTIKDVSDAVIHIRKSKLPDPADLGNAGSFFKNPVIGNDLLEDIMLLYPSIPSYSIDADYSKIPAGWLIEQCGWKGKRVGNTGCHKDQALVIVNYGGATGREIWDFALMVRQSVGQKFGINIEPEVNVVGAE